MSAQSPLALAASSDVSPTPIRGLEAATTSLSRFSIDVEFDASLPDQFRLAFSLATQRWLNVIVGNVPSITVDGETIAGLRVVARADRLDDGYGLGAMTELDERFLRPADAGRFAFLPARATVSLDPDSILARDLGDPALNERFLVDLVSHELGHALGFTRTVWDRKALLGRDAAGAPIFVGEMASEVYGQLRGQAQTAVPLEAYGKNEALISHWRQATFHSELMTFLLESRPNPIGPVTIAALHDLGYDVNRAAAEITTIDLADPRLSTEQPGDEPLPRQMFPIACRNGLASA
jgi:hypothetical protein